MHALFMVLFMSVTWCTSLLGEITTYTLTGNTSSTVAAREALGWLDVSITINQDAYAYMYNHGELIKEGYMGLPYNAERRYCFLGRDTNIPLNKNNSLSNYYNNPDNKPLVKCSKSPFGTTVCLGQWNYSLTFPTTRYNSFVGAINLFEYFPAVASPSTIAELDK